MVEMQSLPSRLIRSELSCQLLHVTAILSVRQDPMPACELQGGGIFCNPESKSAPAKLRLLYEAAPMAFIIEAAGGLSHDGQGSILEKKINSAQDKTVVSLGTREEVTRSIQSLQ